MKKLIPFLTVCLILFYTEIYSQNLTKQNLKITNENFQINKSEPLNSNEPKSYPFPSIFLKGNYVEIGIHPAGSFGCDIWTPVPDNFHATWTYWNTMDSIMGFNSDVQMDGYETGTPAFEGDYFVPGAPLEGWGIEWENATDTLNFNNFGAINDYYLGLFFDISVISFQDLSTKDELIAEWKGEALNNSEKLEVTQTTRLGKDNTYFTIEVTLKNTGDATLNNVEYYRNVDPDNDFVYIYNVLEQGFNYQTINYVKSQPGINDNTDTAIVYATGPETGYPLILGTLDSRAKVSVEGDVSLASGGIIIFDPDSILDTPEMPTQANPQYADNQILLAYELGNMEPGQCVSFVYYYNMTDMENQQIVYPLNAQFQYDLACNTTAFFHDSSFGIGANSIQSWNWDFNDDDIFDAQGSNVSYQFEDYGSYPVTMQVEMCDGTIHEFTDTVTFENTFDLGENIIKCVGESVSIDAGDNYISYLWSTFEETQSISVVEPGLYAATVLTDFGCYLTDYIVVSDTVFNFNLGEDILKCVGDEVTIDAGEGFNSYFWNTLDETQTIQVTEPGFYSVVVTNSFGCSATDEIEIRDSIFEFFIESEIFKCLGDSAILDAGTGYTSYLWSTQEETSSIIVMEEGIYSVTVTNGIGCEATADVEVIDMPLPELYMSADTTIYEGLSVCVSAMDLLSVKMNDGNDGIEFTDVSDFDLVDEFSISVAFRINSAEAFDNYGGIIAKGGGNNPDELDYSLYLWNDGTLKFMTQDENSNQQILTSVQTLNVGEDYNVIITADYISTNLYINGVLDNSIELPLLPRNSSGELNIGRQLSEGYNDFVNCMSLYGVISNVKLWNKKLDILDIMMFNLFLYQEYYSENIILDLEFSNKFGTQIKDNVTGKFGSLVGLSNWSSEIPFEEYLMNGNTFTWLPGNETSTAISILPTETTTYTCTIFNGNCSNTGEVTVNVDPIQDTNLGGQVVYSGGGIAGCKVKRYRLHENGTYQYEEPMVYTDENGYYNFPSTEPGIYILQAIGPNDLPNVLMTYYDSVHTWQLATPVIVENGENINIIIVMRERLKKALCDISGITYYGETAKNETINKGKGLTPAEDITVLINQLSDSPFNSEDENTFYIYFDGTTSNEIGYYQFNDVQYGEFNVYPTLIENPGIPTEKYIFTLDENNLEEQNLDFTIYSSQIVLPVCDIVENGILVYPNPVNGDFCNVSVNENFSGNIRFDIYNSIGQLVSVQDGINKNGNIFKVEIPQNPGIYFIKISSETVLKTVKILKN